ncbi:MAG: aminotransferase class V-fold PLP-dependent enzyme [Rhodothermaceae bacterium]
MTPQESRKLYPYLDTGMIYMNHAACSPLSTPVVEQLNKYIHQRSVTHVENFFDFLPVFELAGKRLANLINAEPERIAWRDNVTSGLNLLAQSLDLKKGDRIIINDLEFPANVYPFLNLQSKGVIVDIVKSVDGKVDLEEIEACIRPETKLLSISQVQFLSGYRANLKKIGELCKANDIIFCVDAIQGAGAVRIDVKDAQIDFLAGGTQKWLMGMQGVGYLYITKELQEKIEPAFVGWTSVNDAWNLLDYNLDLKDDASRFQIGTLSNSGLAAVEASLALMEEIGHDTIEETVIENALFTANKLEEYGFSPLLKNISKENLAGIVTVKIDNAKEIFDELMKKKIVLSEREGMIRFSPHFYNTKDEIEGVVKILSGLQNKFK